MLASGSTPTSGSHAWTFRSGDCVPRPSSWSDRHRPKLSRDGDLSISDLSTTLLEYLGFLHCRDHWCEVPESLSENFFMCVHSLKDLGVSLFFSGTPFPDILLDLKQTASRDHDLTSHDLWSCWRVDSTAEVAEIVSGSDV